MARTIFETPENPFPQNGRRDVSPHSRTGRTEGARDASYEKSAPERAGLYEGTSSRQWNHHPGKHPPLHWPLFLFFFVLFSLTFLGCVSFADTATENTPVMPEDDLPALELDGQETISEEAEQIAALLHDLGVDQVATEILRQTPSEKLQEFLNVYSELVRVRESAEKHFEEVSGEKPDPRPLTGLPPLTGDPRFDASQGKLFLTEAEQQRVKIRQALEFLKKAPLHETGFDAEAERRLYRVRFERAHWKLVQDAAPRIRATFASLNIPLPEDLSRRENDAAARIAALFREEAQILRNFREGEPAGTATSALPSLTPSESVSELPVLPPLPEEPDFSPASASRTVLLERLDSGEPAVPGIPVLLRAALDPEGGAPSERVVYRFESSPAVPFTVSTEATPNEVTAIFPEAGTYAIRCTVLEQGEDSLHPLGTSEEFLLNVEPLMLSLSALPETPYIGQEVTVTAHISPSIPETKRAILWETEGVAAAGKDEGTVFLFRALKTGEATLTAHLTAGDLGGTLASASMSLQIRPYDVTVDLLGPEEPRARIWKPGEGLVPLEEELAVFEKMRVRALISPDFGGEVLFSWATNEGSSVVGELHGAETAFSRHTIGECEVLVTATDREGTELGQGRAVFSVTVDEKTLEDAKKRADAAKKLDEGLAAWARGEGAEAVALLREAHELDPENMAAAAELARISAEFEERQRAAALLVEGDALAAEGRIEEALERYEASRIILANPETDEKIAALTTRVQEQQERLERAKTLRLEGEDLLHKEQISQALAKFRESFAAASDPAVAQQIETLETRLSKARELIAEGVTLQKAQSYPEALEKYRESLTFVKDPRIAEYAQKLEELLRKEEERQRREAEEKRRAEEQARLAAAKKLREEGAALQKAGKLVEAVAKYRESLPFLADPKLEEHIRILEERLHRLEAQEEAKRQEEERRKEEARRAEEERRRLEEERKNEAARLVREGVELQKAERYEEAIIRFRESLSLVRDPRVEEHVTKLEAYVAELSKRITRPVSSPTPVP